MPQLLRSPPIPGGLPGGGSTSVCHKHNGLQLHTPRAYAVAPPGRLGPGYFSLSPKQQVPGAAPGIPLKVMPRGELCELHTWTRRCAKGTPRDAAPAQTVGVLPSPPFLSTLPTPPVKSASDVYQPLGHDRHQQRKRPPLAWHRLGHKPGLFLCERWLSHQPSERGLPHPHFTDGEAEAQQGQVTRPGPNTGSAPRQPRRSASPETPTLVMTAATIPTGVSGVGHLNTSLLPHAPPSAPLHGMGPPHPGLHTSLAGGTSRTCLLCPRTGHRGPHIVMGGMDGVLPG